MDAFPRTIVGGVSLSRLIVGSNWFLGYSHTSAAKDQFIRDYQSRQRIVEILTTFLQYGVDTVMGPPHPLLCEAVQETQQKTGQKLIQVLTPMFDIVPDGPFQKTAEQAFDECLQMGAAVCMPHQCVTDALLDRMYGVIRDIDRYTALIRQRGMVPGLSTHMPESVVIADKTGADVETYIQLYNSSGFLMQVEADWVMRIIRNAKKPVMTIKPLAAGRILPAVGLAFVWNTIRDQDMVAIGTTTPEEAREVVELSMDFLAKRIPENTLQKTRSKTSLQ